MTADLKDSTQGLKLYVLDPLADPRWPSLLERHPQASVFHTPGWLGALSRTYGYRPIAFSSCHPQGPLENGLVFCRIQSWLTGTRLVSLPFSDHCQPLVEDLPELGFLLRAVAESMPQGQAVEIHPLQADAQALQSLTSFGQSRSYWLHRLDLRPGFQELMDSLHPSSVLRKIKRAQAEGLICRQGRCRRLLKHFYQLLSLTRRRHGVPPQPFAWFENLSRGLGDRLQVFVTYRHDQPAAALVSLAYKQVAVYKYGGSDPRHHAAGSVQWTFWAAIQHAKQQGAQEWDMGRTDLDNPGLIRFKERWGASRSRLTYFRCPGGSQDDAGLAGLRKVVPYLPLPLLKAAGRALYRHFG